MLRCSHLLPDNLSSLTANLAWPAYLGLACKLTLARRQPCTENLRHQLAAKLSALLVLQLVLWTSGIVVLTCALAAALCMALRIRAAILLVLAGFWSMHR